MIQLDTHIKYETPEGVEIKLAAAGPVVRGMAWLVDFSIRALVYIVLGILLSRMGGVGQGLMMIGFFLFEWLYATLFEAMWASTPGKRLFNLQVCMDDGTRLSWQAALVRNLLRTVDFLPFLYITGIFSVILNERFKRLGDWVAGTIVVYAEEVELIPTDKCSVSSRPLALPLSLDEQRAILNFSDRRHSLSESRQIELANLLSSITSEKDEENLVALAQHAAWIRGESK